MRFTTLGANESVATLAQRLYRPQSPEAQRAAERALLEANPRLADAASRVPGAVVVVPDVAGAPTADTGSDGNLIAPILTGARERLGDVRDAVRGAVDSRRAALKATLASIASAELQQLARDDVAARDALAEVSRTAKIEAADIDALDRLQAQALDELGQDLDDLLRLVGGTPPSVVTGTPPPVVTGTPPPVVAGNVPPVVRGDVPPRSLTGPDTGTGPVRRSRKRSSRGRPRGN